MHIEHGGKRSGNRRADRCGPSASSGCIPAELTSLTLISNFAAGLYVIAPGRPLIQPCTSREAGRRADRREAGDAERCHCLEKIPTSTERLVHVELLEVGGCILLRTGGAARRFCNHSDSGRPRPDAAPAQQQRNQRKGLQAMKAAVVRGGRLEVENLAGCGGKSALLRRRDCVHRTSRAGSPPRLASRTTPAILS